MRHETGFPSPAQGYEAKDIDFNKYLVQNPAATFIMKITSRDLVYKGVFPGSFVVVDRSRKPESGKLVVFSNDETFLCREYYSNGRTGYFVDAQGEEIPVLDTMTLFGVVTKVIREL